MFSFGKIVIWQRFSHLRLPQSRSWGANFEKNKIFLPFFFLFLFSSCSRKPFIHKKSLDDLKTVRLFIPMPGNKMVFENINSIVYDKIYNHFQVVGFNLVNRKNADFVLETEIKELEQDRKIISPDVLSYGFYAKLDLICKLFHNSKLLKEKKFCFIRLVCKPSNPVLTDSFLEFEYEKLMKSSAIKIEQYFRDYFLEADKK